MAAMMASSEKSGGKPPTVNLSRRADGQAMSSNSPALITNPNSPNVIIASGSASNLISWFDQGR